MEQETVTWKAAEFEYYEKNPAWYLWLTLGAAIIIGIALWQKNFLFAVFILIAALVMGFTGKRTPRDFSFELNTDSLTINDKKKIPYEKMSGFAIIENQNGEYNELFIKTKLILDGDVKIQIPKELTEAIKTALPPSVPEIEYEETLTDRLFKILHF